MSEPLTKEKQKLLVIAPKDEQTIIVSYGEISKEQLSWMVQFFTPNDVHSAVEFLKSHFDIINDETILDIIDSCFPVFKEKNKP